MTDSVGPIVMPERKTGKAAMICPQCATEFQPKRTNQMFCARSCQRVSSRHASRSIRTMENKTVSDHHYDRASRLSEMVYTAAPSERLGVMKHILSVVDHDAGLRRILTDPKLHKAPPRGNNRKTISQAASAYTKKFFGVSIRTYLQQVREGSLKDAETMPPEVDYGSVPMLGRMTKVKCWHKRLSTDAMESSEVIFEKDMFRVAAIVELSQRNGSHGFAEQPAAAA